MLFIVSIADYRNLFLSSKPQIASHTGMQNISEVRYVGFKKVMLEAKVYRPPIKEVSTLNSCVCACNVLTFVISLYSFILFASVSGTGCVSTLSSHTIFNHFHIFCVSSPHGLVLGSMYC